MGDGLKASGCRLAVSVPGTCGELVQGLFRGVPCLVSCPIDRAAVIELEPVAGKGVFVPAEMRKTARALRLALASWSHSEVGVVVRRTRALPESRGYASSTADILAALFGAARLYHRTLSAIEATRIALRVEPTDSLAWPEAVLHSFREPGFIEILGPVPALWVLVVDWGGTIDTLRFNRGKQRRRALEPVIDEAVELLRAGIRAGEPELVGRAATLSARANQTLLFKPQLDTVIRLAREAGAPGVCVAHSGVLIGVLLRPGEAREQSRYILPRLPGKPAGELRRMCAGGPRYGGWLEVQCFF